ncbi:MAG: hypothetical protein V4505_09625 [Pseudomonadota bacterium]
MQHRTIDECARAVLAVTATAWAITPQSPYAKARKAAYGYVPARAVRRMRAAASGLA